MGGSWSLQSRCTAWWLYKKAGFVGSDPNPGVWKKGTMIQDPLDSCLFLAYDRPIQLNLKITKSRNF
jgi:hypothetical protein